LRCMVPGHFVGTVNAALPHSIPFDEP
jgi:hypothetical protein